jgi:penicillin-binding protein 1A
MALGAGSVTPLQMAGAYSVFANGGHRINPWLIARVTDHKGRILSEFTPPAVKELPQAIPERNAFLTGTLLNDVARVGTAARAQATLKRPDLYGKTGTTNDSVDAWFAGYQPSIAAVSWIGYDTPRNLGSRETGGGLSLPIWISFMQHALKGVPVAEVQPRPAWSIWAATGITKKTPQRRRLQPRHGRALRSWQRRPGCHPAACRRGAQPHSGPVQN